MRMVVILNITKAYNTMKWEFVQIKNKLYCEKKPDELGVH